MSPPKTFPFHRSQSPASLPRGNGVSSPLILRRVPRSSNWSPPPPPGRHTSCSQSGPRLWSLPSTTSYSIIKERGTDCFCVDDLYESFAISSRSIAETGKNPTHNVTSGSLWTAHAHIVVSTSPTHNKIVRA